MRLSTLARRRFPAGNLARRRRRLALEIGASAKPTTAIDILYASWTVLRRQRYAQRMELV